MRNNIAAICCIACVIASLGVLAGKIKEDQMHPAEPSRALAGIDIEQLRQVLSE